MKGWSSFDLMVGFIWRRIITSFIDSRFKIAPPDLVRANQKSDVLRGYDGGLLLSASLCRVSLAANFLGLPGMEFCIAKGHSYDLCLLHGS